jgi:hypothetical protein
MALAAKGRHPLPTRDWTSKVRARDDVDGQDFGVFLDRV